MRRRAVFLVFAVFVLSTSAFAGENERHDGFYLGAGMIYNDPDDINGIVALDAGTGLDFKVGYNFGWVALEANSIESGHDGPLLGSDYTLKGLLINVKAYYIPPRYSVRGYLSLGYGDYELDRNNPSWQNYQGSGFHLGPGLEVFLNRHLALNFTIVYRDIEYDHYQDSTTRGTIPVSPKPDGSVLSGHLGLNLYF